MYLLYDDDSSALSINLILFFALKLFIYPPSFPVFLFSYFPIVLFCISRRERK